MRNEKSFFQSVYEVVRLIPPGRVCTYGHIAEFLGSRSSSRMVGWALNASIISNEPIPAHRVVNRKGFLTGKHHFGTPEIMQKMLESEGIKIENDQIMNFERHLWIPAKELR